MSSSCNIQKKSLVPPVKMVREKRKEEGKKRVKRDIKRVKRDMDGNSLTNLNHNLVYLMHENNQSDNLQHKMHLV